MKKFQISLLAIVAIMLIAFSSCTDSITDKSSTGVSYIENATFIPQESNLKSLPIGATRTYTYLINGTTGIGAYAPYELLGEELFFENSAPWVFWQNASHNPETFDMNGVYSNYSPTVQSRMVCEVKNLAGKSTHLGISDFFPSANLFPLSINNQRIGAIIKFNADDLKGIANTPLTGITITVDQMAPVDVLATATTPSNVTTVAGVATWPNWKYIGNASSQTFTITPAQLAATGDVTIYDDVELNILPSATITVSVQIGGITATKTVAGPAIGKGILLNLKTDKVGWYDSNNAVIKENNLVVDPKDLYFE